MEYNRVVCGRGRICALWLYTREHDCWLTCLVLQETDFQIGETTYLP